MEVKERNISELIPAEYNPRYITPEALEHLKASIQRFDAVEPVLVNIHPDRKNIIISGHQRIKAAKSLGLETFPCVELNLDKDKERELNIRMNKNTGAWDWDELATYFDTEELTDWGFTEEELFGNFEEEELEAEEDEYDIPDEIHTDFVLGDLIEIGEHRMLCGDSTDSDQVAKLMDGEKADMVFTDPPYGVDYDGGHAVKGVRREKLKNDGTPDIYNEVLPMIYAFTKKDSPLYLWYSDSKSLPVLSAVLSAGYELRNNIIWNKNVAQFGAIGAQYKTKHEPCLYCYKKGQGVRWSGPNNEVSVWDVDRSSKNEFHPTQKPIELVSRALKNHKADLILDFFLGSGSTMVACHQLNRKCYGMELDPKYCQVIVDRMLKLDPSIEVKVNGEPYGV